MFERYRALLTHGSLLQIDGVAQNQDGDISLKALHVAALPAMTEMSIAS